MYPQLHHLLFELFGLELKLPIQTFGLMVATAFLFGAYILRKELKRKFDEGLLKSQLKKQKIGGSLSKIEIFKSLFFGFILGFKLLGAILEYDYFINNTQKFLLSGEGNLLGGFIAAGISIYLKWRSNKKNRLENPVWKNVEVLPQDNTGNITMVAAISGIIGAKIFAIFESLAALSPEKIARWELNRQIEISNPDYIFNYSDYIFEQLIALHGLTFLGGLIIGSIAVIFYAKRNNLKILPIIDCFAPVMILSYGIGRIGCQLSGDGDWGIANDISSKPEFLSFMPDWLWSYSYPHNISQAGDKMIGCDPFWDPYIYELNPGVFPTPVYETCLSFIIFFILWKLRTKIKIPGILFCIYLMFSSIERYFIENIRVTEELIIGLTQAQFISIILLFTGIIGIFYLRKNYSKSQL
ncbi:MAG: diacylglyceryl transferase [Flavobacteriales bacterium]|nr:diacylglyceryl transferase [Flavobacteriales bacterium]